MHLRRVRAFWMLMLLLLLLEYGSSCGNKKPLRIRLNAAALLR